MPRQVEDKFMLRLPEGLRAVVKEAAARNRRSMNAEILVHLEAVFGEAMREANGRPRAA
jgi:predicted HicB family RNase H-like nuclease